MSRKDECSECRDNAMNVEEWYEKNRSLFSPPICNKLMHKEQMTVMFVGGPNKRRDFHLDRGSEFFYQLRGNMKLPIILPYNKLHIVDIKEGQVFLLPSCVPHSPQRPEDNSLGLVVERERYEDEPDGLRYFAGFDFPKDENQPDKMNVDEILWEKFFWCQSLGQDLVPVVKDFLASDEAKTNQKGENVTSWNWENAEGTEPDRTFEPKFPVNKKIQSVPEPFYLQEWIDQNMERLNTDGSSRLSLFGENHPDKEYVVEAQGVGTYNFPKNDIVDTLIFQIHGECRVKREDGREFIIAPTSLLVIPRGMAFETTRAAGSVGLFVQQHPRKNEEYYGYTGFKMA